MSAVFTGPECAEDGARSETRKVRENVPAGSGRKGLSVVGEAGACRSAS